MLRLNRHITSDPKSPNLAGLFHADDRVTLGKWVYDNYRRDKQTCSKWLKRTQAAMDLAVQVATTKSFPWPNASNITFPLVTIAAMQFHARAYPATLPGTDVVKCRVIGSDPQGKTSNRAQRISEHMSWQVLEEDEPWEEEHDRLLMMNPIVGCSFKKSYYDDEKGHNVSELVPAHQLIMNYFSKSVEDTPCKTEIIPTFRNDIYTRVQTGVYLDILDEGWYTAPTLPPDTNEQASRDQRTGQDAPPQADESTPFTLLEQHTWIDLDGDGYAEPYILTIEESSQTLLRIVARWEREEDVTRGGKSGKKIIKIRATEYYTKYGFIPSPDGGVYDIGFGVLLGPLNESVNSIVNQLVDAGTLQNTSGGFLARGAKLKGGAYTFKPFEWNRIDVDGDIAKSIFPMPVREPSDVLFKLLALLIEYVNRVAGATDLLQGQNVGQNTPAETSRTLVAQGIKIYSDIFKRIWRSMKKEFKKLYILNGMYLPAHTSFGYQGSEISRADYLDNPDRVAPAADPNLPSEDLMIQQALAVKQAAAVTPGYSIPDVERHFLRALKVEAIDVLYPGPGKVPPLPNPKVMVEQIKMQGVQMKMQAQHQQFVMNLIEQRRVNTAKIVNLEAQAAQMLAQAKGVDAGHQIAAFEAAIGALKSHDESLRAHIELAMKQMEANSGDQEGRPGAVENGPGNAGAVSSPPGGAPAQTGAVGEG